MMASGNPDPCLVQNGRSATVLRPGCLGRTRGNRTLLTVGDHLDARLVDALGQQEVTGGGSATLAKGEVVFACTALVTVAFDGDGQRRIGVQETGLAQQGTLSVAVECRTVIVEVNRVADGSQGLFGARPARCRAGR